MTLAKRSPHLYRYYEPDRKSTRLNSSHGYISYAVFCLKKKKRNCVHVQHRENSVEMHVCSILRHHCDDDPVCRPGTEKHPRHLLAHATSRSVAHADEHS